MCFNYGIPLFRPSLFEQSHPELDSGSALNEPQFIYYRKFLNLLFYSKRDKSG